MKDFNEGKPISIERRIGNLNMIAFERKQFADSMNKVADAFKI